MELSIDIRAGRVRLGSLEVVGQWVDFYALLALARTERADPEAYVSAEAVARVGPWRHKASASVGKEVARHLSRLKGKGLGRLVESQGRTRSWRIGVPPNSLSFSPDRRAVQDWIEARSLQAVPTDGWIEDLRTLVDSTVMIQQGEAESTLERLDKLSSALSDAEPALEAWAALLRGRAMFQHHDDDDELLSQLQEAWSERTDPVGRAVGARLRALIARRYRFEDPAATLASLTKLAADLELRGDIASLATVLNVMGLLARRSGNPDAGTGHHLRAAALFGIAGDFPSLQAALFNLTLCREEGLARRGAPPDEILLELVELCRRICACFGVGNDSAQAEICGAQWAHQMGDPARARRYLGDAETLLRKIDSTYDQACFLEIRAQIERAAPDGKSDPDRDLRTAETLFARAGDEPSAARVRRALSPSSDPRLTTSAQFGLIRRKRRTR